MDASAKQLLTSIKKKNFQPVYVLQGTEPYYIDLVGHAFEEGVVQEHERSFNQVILYGKDVTVQAVLNHARRFPMMADRQLVLVREAQEILDLNKEQGGKLMVNYINNPVPSTVLVLCYKHKTLDKRKELGKKMDALGFTFTFEPLKQNQLGEFAGDYLSARGYSAEPQAIYVLCESVGTDLSRLANEIDKILIGRPPDKVITPDEVLRMVGISREFNNFEFQKAVATRNVPKTFEIVRYFQANTKRNPVIVTIAFMYTFFSKLLIAAHAKDKSERALVAELRISPYAVREYVQSLSLYSPEQIKNALSQIKTADLKIKGVNSGGSDDHGQILQELMAALMLA